MGHSFVAYCVRVCVCARMHREKRERGVQLLPTPFDTASIRREISHNNLQTLKIEQDGKKQERGGGQIDFQD